MDNKYFEYFEKGTKNNLIKYLTCEKLRNLFETDLKMLAEEIM